MIYAGLFVPRSDQKVSLYIETEAQLIKWHSNEGNNLGYWTKD